MSHISYAKLSSIINYIYTAMYTIKLDNAIIHTTADKLSAVAVYRSLLKRSDLSDNTHTATLLDDATVLHTSIINTASAQSDIVSTVTANDILRIMTDSLQLSPKDVKKLAENIGLSISTSKANGWFLDADKRKHQNMQLDELYLITKAIFNDTLPEQGYTPCNYQALVAKTGLTPTQFWRHFSIAERTFYNHYKGSRTMPFDDWQTLLKRVQSYIQKKA